MPRRGRSRHLQRSVDEEPSKEVASRAESEDAVADGSKNSSSSKSSRSGAGGLKRKTLSKARTLEREEKQDALSTEEEGNRVQFKLAVKEDSDNGTTMSDAPVETGGASADHIQKVSHKGREPVDEDALKENRNKGAPKKFESPTKTMTKLTETESIRSPANLGDDANVELPPGGRLRSKSDATTDAVSAADDELDYDFEDYDDLAGSPTIHFLDEPISEHEPKKTDSAPLETTMATSIEESNARPDRLENFRPDLEPKEADAVEGGEGAGRSDDDATAGQRGDDDDDEDGKGEPRAKSSPSESESDNDDDRDCRRRRKKEEKRLDERRVPDDRRRREGWNRSPPRRRPSSGRVHPLDQFLNITSKPAPSNKIHVNPRFMAANQRSSMGHPGQASHGPPSHGQLPMPLGFPPNSRPFGPSGMNCPPPPGTSPINLALSGLMGLPRPFNAAMTMGNRLLPGQNPFPPFYNAQYRPPMFQPSMIPQNNAFRQPPFPAALPWQPASRDRRSPPRRHHDDARWRGDGRRSRTISPPPPRRRSRSRSPRRRSPPREQPPKPDPPKALTPEEAEYQRKLEEQKRKRQEVLRRKEENRQRAAKEKEAEMARREAARSSRRLSLGLARDSPPTAAANALDAPGLTTASKRNLEPSEESRTKLKRVAVLPPTMSTEGDSTASSEDARRRLTIVNSKAPPTVRDPRIRADHATSESAEPKPAGSPRVRPVVSREELLRPPASSANVAPYPAVVAVETAPETSSETGSKRPVIFKRRNLNPLMVNPQEDKCNDLVGKQTIDSRMSEVPGQNRPEIPSLLKSEAPSLPRPSLPEIQLPSIESPKKQTPPKPDNSKKRLRIIHMDKETGIITTADGMKLQARLIKKKNPEGEERLVKKYFRLSEIELKSLGMKSDNPNTPPPTARAPVSAPARVPVAAPVYSREPVLPPASESFRRRTVITPSVQKTASSKLQSQDEPVPNPNEDPPFSSISKVPLSQRFQQLQHPPAEDESAAAAPKIESRFVILDDLPNSKSITEKEIRYLCSRVGPIFSVQYRRSENRALVKFKLHEDAYTFARDFDGCVFGEKRIQVYLKRLD